MNTEVTFEPQINKSLFYDMMLFSLPFEKLL